MVTCLDNWESRLRDLNAVKIFWNILRIISLVKSKNEVEISLTFTMMSLMAEYYWEILYH